MATDPAQQTQAPPQAPAAAQPAAAQPEQAPVKTPKVAREITGTIRPKITVPMHVTKHPNPVGRPRNPRP